MDNNVIERILDLVNNCDLNDKQLLEKLEISNSSTITDWRNGKSKAPSMKNLVKIAKYFNVSTDYLLTGRENNLSEKELAWLKLYHSIPDNLKNELTYECHGFISGYICKNQQVYQKDGR